MGNNLNMDLEEKDVVVMEKHMRKEFHELSKRIFHAISGFGTKIDTIGSKIYGYYQFEGKKGKDMIRGGYIERLATPKEVENAIKLQNKSL